MSVGEARRIALRLAARRHRLSLILIALAAIAFCAIGVWMRDPLDFGIALILVLMPAVVALKFHLLLKDQAKLYGAEQTPAFHEEGLNVEDSLGNDSTTAWPTFESALDWPDYWLFFYSKRNCFVVPKRAFSDAQVEEIMGILRAKGLLK